MRTLMNRAADIGRERARYLAMRYGKELRIARVGGGLTQRQLATRAGVSQGFVSLVERGMRQPRWDIACSLAAACGCELGLKLHPSEGLHLRDSGQMRLADSVASAAHAAWRVRLEQPIGDGSRRPLTSQWITLRSAPSSKSSAGWSTSRRNTARPCSNETSSRD